MDTTTATPAAAQQSLPKLEPIPVSQIQPSPYQVRKDFDPDSLKGLAESMDKEGLIQPIVVRKVADHYELISGERRLRAAQSLGWPNIEAKVIQTGTEEEAAAKGLIENIQRQDINPIEEAEGFELLQRMNPKEWTDEKIAQTIGKGRTYVSQSIAMLELPESIKENVRRRTLSRSHALELLPLEPAKQKEAAKQAVTKGLSIKETRKLTAQMKGKVQKDEYNSSIEQCPTSDIPPRPEIRPAKNTPLQEPPKLSDVLSDQAEWGKNEITHRYLWFLGPIGRWLTNSLFASIKSGNWKRLAMVASLLLMVYLFWQPVWFLVTWPFRAIHDSWNNRGVTATVTKSPTPAPLATVAAILIPTPEITASQYVAGNKIRLEWKPIGEGYLYKIFYDWDYDAGMPHFREVRENTVSTSGAIIDIGAKSLPADRNVAVAVQAISPDGIESDLSKPLGVTLTVSNRENEVLPLPTPIPPVQSMPKPQAAKPKTSPAEPKVEAANIPAPKNLRWSRSGTQGVRLSWESPGPGYRYNVYAAYAGDKPTFDVGNDDPLKGPEITWTAPSEGTQVFEIYLKAVDPQGRESAPSNHIIADLR
jgi:ParB family transcriptional regulator, chromosome partitioning protein